MRILPVITSALVLATSYAFAGERTTVSSGKGFKASTVAPEVTCFKAQEFQLDLFGAYVDGNASDHAGPWKDHGWGGGLGLNYFFSRQIGLGVEGTAIYGRENPQADTDKHSSSDHGRKTIYGATGSIIVRFPVDRLCLAPYVYVGGGFDSDSEDWAKGHVGVGLEYRIVPQKVGLFIDGRWTYYGDRYDNGDQNNFLAKAGVRIVF